jgi:hypothetical protein
LSPYSRDTLTEQAWFPTDIALTTSALFPYAYYRVSYNISRYCRYSASHKLSQPGRAVVVPVAFHSALAIISSALIFPTSVAAQYTAGLRAVICPLYTGFRQHLSLLETSTASQDFSPKAVRASASKSESALAPLAASARLLGRDISWGRFSGKDLDGMRGKIQRLVMRAHGMNVYFTLTDPTRERFPVTPVPSQLGSPAMGTPNVSRPSSPSRTEESPSASPALPHSPVGCSQSEQHRGRPVQQRHPHFDIDRPSRSVKAHSHSTLFRRHHRQSHISLLMGVHHHDNLREHVVGVFESQRYLDLESHHFAHPLAAYYTERSTTLLRQSCEPLLRACSLGLEQLDLWLRTSRRRRWMFWWGGQECFVLQQERLDALHQVCEELTRAVERFRTTLRFVIYDPCPWLTSVVGISFWNHIVRHLATSTKGV